VITGSPYYSQAPNATPLPAANFTYSFGDPNNTGLTVNSSTVFGTGSSGVYVFNINGDFSAITPHASLNNPAILTLNGAANDTFIFNVYSSGSDGGLTLSGVSMNLTGGLLASNVIFDVVNGGTVSILNSTAYGTFYTSSGDIYVNGSNVTGGLVDGGGSPLGISVLGSTVTADSFVAPGPPVVAAPEMPTIMTTGLGAAMLVAGSYFNSLRRKRSISGRALAA
jgi:hypothetical protein